ncbi:FG-GAP repeat domain-containing protein [Glycomyces niveus]|uniref:VCBS repeat-containing protein n=1 Tax=Glycomyces niveus TaxID=2820287 RepID=A0ABS3U6A9_9ACTN|nr:VCBS repeat-containing protein [Glycomyces sp. NEAU-S30]MBO3734286.1 VCBS repeat-containing protein [Glycomyces sp. NEAU-S30]
MSPDSPRARRAGLRLLAATAAGCTAAAAFAAPAAAEIPGITGDPVAALQLVPDLDNTEMTPSSMTVDYTRADPDDTATHAVVTELVFEDPYGVLDITTSDPACDVSTPATIVCSADAAPHTEFLFDVIPASSAEDGSFDYTFKASIDGVDIAGSTGAFGVVSDYDVHNPYAHGDFVQTGVVEDDNILVKPVFYQAFDLAPTTEAVVVTFSNPVAGEGLDTTGLATARDLYDNCRATSDAAGATGLECVITDFSDAKGQFLTLSAGVAFKIGSDVVGPLDVCGCQYSVETINAATLAEEYDDLSWATSNGTSVGLTTAPEGWDGAAESKAFYWGGITLTTSENKYDLAVQEITLKGNLNTNATVTTKVSNGGSAAADDLNPASDSYLVRAQLPQGTELVRVDSDGNGTWECYGTDELDAVYSATPNTGLERFDLACTIDGLEPGQSADFTFTAKLTDTTAFQGAIEVGAVYNEDEYEGDFYNDFALIYNNAVEARYDYNRDGYEDLFVVRKSDNALRFYAGTSAGTYKSGVTVGTGWGAYDIIMAGDLTGDDIPDFLARDTRNGTLYTYPGNGKGGHGTRISNGTGWGKMGQIAVGQYDGDGDPDLIATAFSDGKMYFYEGLGNGKFGTREAGGEGWDGYDVITSLGDLDLDGFDEFLTRWNTTGVYQIYTSQGEVYDFAQDLDTYPYSNRRYEQVIGVGDLKRDGRGDIAAVDVKTGQLVVRYFDPAQGYISNASVIGSSGWSTVRLPVINLDRTYDYDGDGFSDFVAQRKSNGDILLYFGTGKGHATPWRFCEGCDGVTALAAGGDYTADGRLDVLYRFNGGLYTVHGIDDGVHYGFDGEDVYAGSGWNGMSDISGGHDYTSDGKDDLVARHSSTGVLYVYPGKGDGTFGSRITVGSGWNGMRETNAVGDLNHDGHADLLSIAKSDSCLYLYKGNGNGTFKSRVQVSCGWKSYEAITGVGDFNRDGHADFLSRRVTDGILFLYPGNGAGGHGSRVQIGTGWNAMNIG